MRFQRVRVINPPQTTPVSLSEMKEHLRVVHTDEDQYITLLVEAATRITERYLGRRLIDTGLRLTLDGYGLQLSRADWWGGVRQGRRGSDNERSITLPDLPLQSVDEIRTFNRSDTPTAYAASNYIVDAADPDLHGRVVLRDSATWPADLREANAIEVDFVAGYGQTATDIPEALRQGVLMVGAFMYNNRGDCVEPKQCVEQSGAAAIIGQWRITSVGAA